MTIQNKTWRRYGWLGAIISIPTTIYLFWEPDFGQYTEPLQITAYAIMIFFGGSGMVVAILERFGVLKFSYTDDDRQRWGYRMCRSMAEMELNHGRPFSLHYYENYRLTPEQRKE
jgi:hypothetical protein